MIDKDILLKEIKSNFDNMFNRQFFKNNSLIKKLNLKDVELNYFIEENNEAINVKIVRDKNNKNKYTIIFYYGFLEYFFKQAQDFAKKILKRNDGIYLTVFYYWMEMVFLHEWSHLTRNHFNLLTKGASFSEFGVTSNDISTELRRCLEIDADRFAGIFFAGIGHLTFKELENLLKFNDSETIELFIKLVYYLFYKLNAQSDLYPPSLLRTIIFLTGFQEAKYKNNEIFNFINLKDLEQNIRLILIQESWKNKENIKPLQANLKIFDKYDKCIKELLNGRN